VRLVETGLGIANTAHALTCALQAGQPDLVLQVGVGGAYLSSGLRVGDIAVASEENYGQLGVRTREGWQPAELIGIPVLQAEGTAYFNRFPLEPAWVARAETALRGAVWEGGPVAVGVGPFVTAEECSGTAELGAARAARFRAICENMEGAAAAHLCRLYGAAFVEVRGISNLVEDRCRARWNLPLAASRAQQAALLLLAGLEPR
jgi:futalosine hydrolase